MRFTKKIGSSYTGKPFVVLTDETNLWATQEALQKLAVYEDAEEQGRLRILPCAPGDIVYHVHASWAGDCILKKLPYYIEYARFDPTSFDFYENRFHRHYYQTREDAEEALDRGLKTTYKPFRDKTEILS